MPKTKRNREKELKEQNRAKIIAQLPEKIRNIYTETKEDLERRKKDYRYYSVALLIVGIIFGVVSWFMMYRELYMSSTLGAVLPIGVAVVAVFAVIYYYMELINCNAKLSELEELWDKMLEMIETGEVSVEEAVEQLNAVLQQEEQKEQAQQAQSPQLHVNNLTAEEAQMLELLLKKAQNQNRNQNQ